MRMKLVATILAAFCFCVDALHQAGAREQTQDVFNVGYRVMTFKGEGAQAKTVPAAVWYPTAARAEGFTYAGPTAGKAATNAAPLEGKGAFPLLVFAHGYGGCALGSVYLTESLARRGWIVVAPDHSDKDKMFSLQSGRNKDVDGMDLLKGAKDITASTPADREKYVYRLDEMKLALDGVLASDVFAGLIDTNRIAVGGHSMGGFSALGLCGTIQERHDKRIKAVLLLSSGAGAYLFREAELAGVKMPAMVWVGEREKEQKRGQATMAELAEKIYGHMISPKFLVELKGGSHFSFNNRLTDTRVAGRFSGTDEQFEVIEKYSAAFLESYVAGRSGTTGVLAVKDPLFTRYVHDPAVLPEAAAKPAPGAEVAGELKRVHVFVSGKVQGVGFRDFTSTKARGLKLTGWVKNLNDGRVELIAEGPSGAIDELVAAVHKGPRAARVDKVEVKEEPHKGEFKSFVTGW